MTANSPLLEIRDLRKEFPVSKSLFSKKRKTLQALGGINLTIGEGETLGLVGESGCGKSTLGRTLLHLIPPTSGHVFYRGEDLEGYNKEQIREMRKKMQIIFQDPYGSLNPRMTVEQQVKAPLDVYHLGSEEERRERVLDMLERVGLGKQHLKRYPHEFSGGQRQRIGIARALILRPEFVVCDEPVSALDVSVRAQVLNLMAQLRRDLGLTFLFVSHDLSVVKHISDRVAVMYLGNIVEIAGRDQLYENPLHPYTKALLSAIPIPDKKVKRERIYLTGDVPSALNPPSGCRFHPRCPYAMPVCREQMPEMRQTEAGHQVACHLAEGGAAG